MLISQSKRNFLQKKSITFLRKNHTPESILCINCSFISRQPEEPVFFCPYFCFSRIQSSLKCISFMIHFTLMEIKLTTFCSNSVYLERGLCFMNWLGTHMTPMQCRVVCAFSCGGVGEFACRTFACLVFLWSFACWVNYLAQITCRHLLVGTYTCRTFTCRQMLVDIYLQDISLWDIYL